MTISMDHLAAAAIPDLAEHGAIPGLPSTRLQPGSPYPFGNLLTEAIGNVNQLDDQARITVDRMMTGSGVDVHQAMIATQKASMAFELALAVRNKAVQAYQTVIGMQF